MTKNNFNFIIAWQIFNCCFFYPAAAQREVGYWQGMVTHQEKHWEIAVDINRQADTLQAMVNFLDLAARDVPFSITLYGGEVHLERPQPNGKAIVFKGFIDNGTMEGKFTGVGVVEAPFLFRKSTPSPSYVKEDMEITNDSVTLSGTLITPAAKGKYPLVIFIHGGSPDLRRVYYGPAIGFVQNGFAVLIYDKRGVGQSKRGHWQTDGIKALASDAVAWVQHVKKHGSVDKNNITVYGHSEGGWTAPMAAMMCKDIKNIIISGASAVSASEQTKYSRKKVMEHEGFNDSIINAAIDLWDQIYVSSRLCYSDTVAAVQLKSIIQKKINTVHDEAWFSPAALPYIYSTDCPSKGFLDLLYSDPLQVWSKINQPVLGVWGREDIVVPVDTSVTLIKNTLARSGNKNFTSRVLPGLDHSGNVIANTDQWDFPRSSKDFFQVMVSWLAGQNKT